MLVHGTQFKQTFQVDLNIPTSEAFGPLTNKRMVGMLHPDQHTQNPDAGREATAYRANTLSTWLPGLLAAENVAKKHGEELVELHPLKAAYRESNQGNVLKS